MKRLTRTFMVYLLTTLLLGETAMFAQQLTGDSGKTVTPSTERRELQQSLSSLQELIEQALENNPEIKLPQRRFDMMRARVPQAKALDQPMLSIGYTNL